MKELKDPDSTSNKVRIGLVILQFTVSVFMILSTVIIYRQMGFFLGQDMGWDKENLMAITLNGRAYDLAENNPGTFKDELNQLAFVKGSTFTSGLPGDRFSVEGLTPDIPRDEEFDNPSIRFLRVDEDFIPLMGIRITEGRNLKHTSGKNSEFLINEAARKVLELQDPVGLPAESMFGQQGDIVGVTEDFHYASLQQIIEPLVLEVNYDPEFRGLWYQYLLLKLEPGNLDEKIAALKSKMEELAEGYIMNFTFLDDNINKNYKSEKRLKELLSAFAILAVFISCLGLFGLSAFSAELRTKEMGIRKAMGASVIKIVFRMSRGFLIYVCIALVLALPLGFYAMSRWLQNFAYHIDIQWWEFILTGLLSILITLVSVGFQAVKAAISNPVEALRYE
jgi:putative ABC transport system permease protein